MYYYYYYCHCREDVDGGAITGHVPQLRWKFPNLCHY